MGIRIRVPFFIATIFKQIMAERMLIVFECWKFQIGLESIASLHLALYRWILFSFEEEKIANYSTDLFSLPFNKPVTMILGNWYKCRNNSF